MDEIIKVYNILYNKYGRQGWWPLTIKNNLSEHHQGPPKNNKHRFEIIIGAILTQNTNWKNVEKALHNLSKNNLLDLDKISKAKKERLGELIRPAGYYNQKSERLKIIADYVIKNYKGNLNLFFNKDMIELRQELLSIKGIGPETADSIILYSAEKPIFVIDAYTKRIFGRLGIKKTTYDGWQELFMADLKPNLDTFKEYHALIVELAKRHCKTKPICDGCILSDLCRKIFKPSR
ncbi:MAG: endonuclease [Nanoarchaeota archaeon]